VSVAPTRVVVTAAAGLAAAGCGGSHAAPAAPAATPPPAVEAEPAAALPPPAAPAALRAGRFAVPALAGLEAEEAEGYVLFVRKPLAFLVRDFTDGGVTDANCAGVAHAFAIGVVSGLFREGVGIDVLPTPAGISDQPPGGGCVRHGRIDAAHGGRLVVSAIRRFPSGVASVFCYLDATAPELAMCQQIIDSVTLAAP